MRKVDPLEAMETELVGLRSRWAKGEDRERAENLDVIEQLLLGEEQQRQANGAKAGKKEKHKQSEQLDSVLGMSVETMKYGPIQNRITKILKELGLWKSPHAKWPRAPLEAYRKLLKLLEDGDERVTTGATVVALHEMMNQIKPEDVAAGEGVEFEDGHDYTATSYLMKVLHDAPFAKVLSRLQCLVIAEDVEAKHQKHAALLAAVEPFYEGIWLEDFMKTMQNSASGFVMTLLDRTVKLHKAPDSELSFLVKAYDRLTQMMMRKAKIGSGGDKAWLQRLQQEASSDGRPDLADHIAVPLLAFNALPDSSNRFAPPGGTTYSLMEMFVQYVAGEPSLAGACGSVRSVPLSTETLEAARAMTLEGQRALPKCQNILTEPAQKKKLDAAGARFAEMAALETEVQQKMENYVATLLPDALMPHTEEVWSRDAAGKPLQKAWDFEFIRKANAPLRDKALRDNAMPKPATMSMLFSDEWLRTLLHDFCAAYVPEQKKFYDKLKRTDKAKAQVQTARAKQAAPGKGADATAPKVSPPDMVGALVNSELFKKMQTSKAKQAAPAKGAFADMTAPKMSPPDVMGAMVQNELVKGVQDRGRVMGTMGHPSYLGRFVAAVLRSSGALYYSSDPEAVLAGVENALP